MKEYIKNITKGDWVFDELSMKIKGSGDYEGRTVIANVSPRMDYSRGMTTQCANAQLISEAGTVANQCGLTPKELLEQRNELRDMLYELYWNKNNSEVQTRAWKLIKETK